MNGILGIRNKKKEEKNHLTLSLIMENDASTVKTTELQEALKKMDCPTNSVQAENEKAAVPASKSRSERRKLRRASAKVLVRLRPADRNDPRFEEVLGTLNASRANLYIVTTSRNYYKLMRLRVTFPFDSAHDNDSSPEESAEVVRLDHLPNGRTGVAIQLKQATHSQSRTNSTSSVSVEQPASDQRFSVRHLFSAAATLIEANSGVRLRARCSDLSMAGCYIDTLNPFPKDSRVLLQLSSNDVNFVALAQVITHHVGMGMGLAFEKLESGQKAILVDWLSTRLLTPSLAAKVFQTPHPPESAESQESSDRALLLKMLRKLESDGKLVPF
jgi:hypothetical protein